jgi:hypothetical protein
MSESSQSTSPPDIDAGVVEEVDALPVLAGESQVAHAQASLGALPLQRRSAGVVIPAVQAAAVAAGGFVAGAAVAGLVHRRQRRSPAIAKRRRAARAVGGARTPGARGTGRAVELVQIVGSRSLLVDVHLLGGSGDR